MGFFEIFGQGKDSDKDRNGSFCIEDTVTAVAVELAFLLKLVRFMIFYSDFTKAESLVKHCLIKKKPRKKD